MFCLQSSHGEVSRWKNDNTNSDNDANDDYDNNINNNNNNNIKPWDTLMEGWNNHGNNSRKRLRW